jgi:hypothetical protein
MTFGSPNITPLLVSVARCTRAPLLGALGRSEDAEMFNASASLVSEVRDGDVRFRSTRERKLGEKPDSALS